MFQITPFVSIPLNILVKFRLAEFPHNSDSSFLFDDDREGPVFLHFELIQVFRVDLPYLLLRVQQFFVVFDLVQQQHGFGTRGLDHVGAEPVEVQCPETGERSVFFCAVRALFVALTHQFVECQVKHFLHTVPKYRVVFTVFHVSFWEFSAARRVGEDLVVGKHHLHVVVGGMFDQIAGSESISLLVVVIGNRALSKLCVGLHRTTTF